MRRAAPRRRPRAVGRGLLLPDAAPGGAGVLGGVLHAREGAGRSRPQPVPRPDRRGAVGVLRLRLFEQARTETGDERATVSRRRPTLRSAIAYPRQRSRTPSGGPKGPLYTPVFHILPPWPPPPCRRSWRELPSRSNGAAAPKRCSCSARRCGRATWCATTSSPCARRWPRPGCCRTTSSRRRRALGRPPDTFRDTISPSRLSTLWRLHGRLASARGDQSRAIACTAAR